MCLAKDISPNNLFPWWDHNLEPVVSPGNWVEITKSRQKMVSIGRDLLGVSVVPSRVVLGRGRYSSEAGVAVVYIETLACKRCLVPDLFNAGDPTLCLEPGISQGFC